MGFLSKLLKRGLKKGGRSTVSDYVYQKTRHHVHGKKPTTAEKRADRRKVMGNERLADETRVAWLAKLNKQRELTLRKRQFGDLATNTASGRGAGANFIYKPSSTPATGAGTAGIGRISGGLTGGVTGGASRPSRPITSPTVRLL